MDQETKAKSENTSVKSESGFSLLEILIALALLAGAGTFVMTKVFQSQYKGKVSTARSQMATIVSALKNYKRDCYVYPTGDQGIKALINKPTSGRECKNYDPNGYLGEDSDSEVPFDPWDCEYHYESDGKKIKISSLGADCAKGGEDQDADIPLRKKRKRRGQ